MTKFGQVNSASDYSGDVITYNASGIVPITKRWIGLITPNTGNGYVVDVSSASFNNILNVQAITIKNTSAATAVPKISLKNFSNTQVVLNIIEGNSSLVTILGFNVLQGVSESFANVTGLTIYLLVEGN